MKKTILLGLAAVAVFFTGCVKDQTIDNLVDTDIQRGALVEKGLVFEDDTRLERDGVSGKLAWSEGDQISINGVASNTLTAEQSGSSKATFVVSGTLQTPYCIAYPAAAEGKILFAPFDHSLCRIKVTHFCSAGSHGK